MPSDRIKVLLAAGAVGITVAASCYYLYSQRQRRKRDDTDEGIGDEDSIISDSEDPAILKDLTTPVTIAPRNDEEINHFQFNTAPHGKNHIAPHDEKQIRETYEIDNLDTHETLQAKDNEQAQGENVESSDSEEEVTKKVLILGLDGSGKTALVETLTKHQDRTPHIYKATNGFNVAQAKCDGFSLNIMEVGGGEKTRQYWPNFLQDTDLLVYVIDGSDLERFSEAKHTLAKILAEEALAQVPCLLLSNKQDIKGAVSCTEIVTDDDMKEFGSNRHLKLTLLNSVCIPEPDNVVTYADTLMAVILNLLE